MTDNKIELDVQDIFNDLKEKLTDAEMRESYAKAQVKAQQRKIEEQSGEIAQLTAIVQENANGQDLDKGYQVIEGDT